MNQKIIISILLVLVISLLGCIDTKIDTITTEERHSRFLDSISQFSDPTQVKHIEERIQTLEKKIDAYAGWQITYDNLNNDEKDEIKQYSILRVNFETAHDGIVCDIIKAGESDLSLYADANALGKEYAIASKEYHNCSWYPSFIDPGNEVETLRSEVTLLKAELKRLEN